jgi:hypothetical protein
LEVTDFDEAIDSGIKRCVGRMPWEAHFQKTSANELHGGFA